MCNRKKQDPADEICELAHELTAPDKMGKEHALEVLEDVVSRLENACDCLRDEIKDG